MHAVKSIQTYNCVFAFEPGLKKKPELIEVFSTGLLFLNKRAELNQFSDGFVFQIGLGMTL